MRQGIPGILVDYGIIGDEQVECGLADGVEGCDEGSAPIEGHDNGCDVCRRRCRSSVVEWNGGCISGEECDFYKVDMHCYGRKGVIVRYRRN